MARKRTLEEVEKFDEFERGIASAKVYGVLLSLSPVKKLFRGNSGSSKLRLVGFDSGQ